MPTGNFLSVDAIIENFIEELHYRIDENNSPRVGYNFSASVIAALKNNINTLSKAQGMIYDIERLYSKELSEEDFLERARK